MKHLKQVESASEAVQEDYEVVYYASEDDKVILKAVEETASQYEYVDLGLPSGLKWATCNVGATKPEEYGKFFQWGDTVGYYEGQGAEEHSYRNTTPYGTNSVEADYWDDTNPAFSKYLGLDFAVRGPYATSEDALKTVLDSSDDAAYVGTLGKAHMPTKEDFDELIANTTNEWVTNYDGSGVNGRLFTSKNK